ncbi:MAG: hypothetical protein ACIAXF_12870 [Phycisphaerales bacterium JB063]
MNPQTPDDNSAKQENESLDASQIAEMEAALSSLPLAQPTPLLDHRVACALRQPDAAPTAPSADALPLHAVPPARSHRLTWVAVAAVVALLAALCVGLYLEGPATPASHPIAEQAPETPGDPSHPHADTPGESTSPQIARAGYTFQPDPMKLHWTRDLDQGLLTSDAGQPVRAIRRQDVEQEVWVDVERGVTVQITRPRERIVVVKQPTF